MRQRSALVCSEEQQQQDEEEKEEEEEGEKNICAKYFFTVYYKTQNKEINIYIYMQEDTVYIYKHDIHNA